MTRSGTAEATIELVELHAQGRSTRTLQVGDSAVFSIVIAIHSPIPDLTAGILIRDRLGNDIFGTNTFHLGARRFGAAAGEKKIVEFSFPSLDLGVGSYSVSVALHAADEHTRANFDWWDRALVFEVVPGDAPVSVGVCTFEVSAAWRPGTTGLVAHAAQAH